MIESEKENSEQEQKQEREIVRALIALQSESPIRSHSSYPLSILWNMFQHIEGNGLFECEITIKDEKIEEIFTRNFKFFLDNYPEVMDITAKGATMYKTKPIDYTGCDPVIAEHLKRGEAVLCSVHGSEAYVSGFDDSGASAKYCVAGDGYYSDATPVKLTTYRKKASEIVKWLEDNGYKVDMDGDWYKKQDIPFHAEMFQYCGNSTPSGSSVWHEEWLEYR